MYVPVVDKPEIEVRVITKAVKDTVGVAADSTAAPAVVAASDTLKINYNIE